MAKSRENEIMQGASGAVGRMLVFRQRGTKTIIARRARANPNRTYSEDQLAIQERFADAVLYAKQAISNPELREAYRQKANPNQTAYNVAFKDYLTPPEVRRVNDAAYTGVIGDEIIIRVKDVMQVLEVEVEIYNGAGILIEASVAENLLGDGVDWRYEAQTNNEEAGPFSMKVIMRDTPGNVTTEEVTLNLH